MQPPSSRRSLSLDGPGIKGSAGGPIERSATIVWRHRILAMLLAFGALAPAPSSEAQTRRLRFKHLRVEEGLSNSWVQTILRDSHGFLWVGTQDGLNRYDGNTIKVYRHDPQDPESLASSVVGALLEDSKKRLWVASGWGDGGVALYDPEHDRFKTYWLRRGQTNANHVRSIFEDRRGQLWLGTDNAVVLLDPESGDVKRFPMGAEGTDSGSAVVLFEDGRSRLWVGTNLGLLQFDRTRGRFTHWSAEDSELMKLAHADVWDIYEEPSGALWFATLGQGLFRVAPGLGQGTRFAPDPRNPHSISSERVRRIVAAGDDTLIIGTENGGIDILDLPTRTFTPELADPEDEASLSSNSIWSLHLDSQGILWVGSYNGGVDYSLRERFHHLRARRGGLSDGHVGSVLEDRLGNLWIGTDGGGLNRLNQRTGAYTYYRYDPKNGATIGSNAVFALCEDSSGMIWTGGWASGLGRLDPASGRVTRYRHDPENPASLVNDNIWRIVELRGGELLVVTHGGVDLFKRRTGTFTHLTARGLGNQATFFSGDEDGEGRLWLVGTGFCGYLERETGRTKRYQHDPEDPQSLGEGWVQALYIDSVGNVWLGTEGGLSCFAAGTNAPRRYTMDDGLPNDTVMAIQEDGSGSLWVATNRGLSKLVDAIRLPDDPTILNFDVHDGLQGYETARNAACRGQDGQMFFGGPHGLSSFFPEQIQQNPQPPPVVLTGLKIFNKPVAIGAPGSPLRESITRTEALTLSHKYTTVTFEFAALNLILPQKNQYAYKLEGFDADWNHVGSQRTATYTNLPPDNYTLRVRASNNDGVWNDQGVALAVTVTPPFWQTWWFRTLAGLVVLLLAFGVYEWRVAALRARQRELAQKIEEQTADMHTLMDNIPDLIYFKDRQGRYTRVNRAQAAVLGLAEPDQAVGRTDADFFPEEYARAAAEAEAHLFASGEPLLGRLEHEPRSGRWFLATRVPTREAGQVAGLVGISRDITERRLAEEQLERDLAAFRDFVSAVAEGDLTQRGSEGEDTLGRIAVAVNSMLAGFAKILTDVRDAAFSVSTASTQILAASTQIAKGAQYGRDQVHNTQSAVEEMVASMAQVAESAQESAAASLKVLEHIHESDRAVDAATQAMTRIDGAVSSTAEKMRVLGDRSQEISEIIDLIEEIASHSELLSINAAIEAAHAGDAGRGFSVVATEIHHLTERSTDATRNVTAIVKGMLAETQGVLAAMENSMREVKVGLELSLQARQGLHEISLLVQQASEVARDISMAAGEQATTTRTVAEAMNSISNITEQSTAGSRETAHTVQDLVSLSERLTQTIARFTIDRPETLVASDASEPPSAAALAELTRHLGRIATQLESRGSADGDDGAEAAPSAPDIARVVGSVAELVSRMEGTSSGGKDR